MIAKTSEATDKQASAAMRSRCGFSSICAARAWRNHYYVSLRMRRNYLPPTRVFARCASRNTISRRSKRWYGRTRRSLRWMGVTIRLRRCVTLSHSADDACGQVAATTDARRDMHQLWREELHWRGPNTGSAQRSPWRFRRVPHAIAPLSLLIAPFKPSNGSLAGFGGKALESLSSLSCRSSCAPIT